MEGREAGDSYLATQTQPTQNISSSEQMSQNHILDKLTFTGIYDYQSVGLSRYWTSQANLSSLLVDNFDLWDVTKVGSFAEFLSLYPTYHDTISICKYISYPPAPSQLRGELCAAFQSPSWLCVSLWDCVSISLRLTERVWVRTAVLRSEISSRDPTDTDCQGVSKVKVSVRGSPSPSHS